MTAKRTAKQQKTTRSHAGGRWCRAFLAALSINGNVTLSAEKAGIDRVTAYRWREKHPAFAVQWDEALEESADRLEAEARRRAELGTLKPVWYRGEHVGDELEYSDQLMALMLKGHKPDKYGDKLTIRLDPQQVAVLQRYGLTPGEAMERLIQELANDE